MDAATVLKTISFGLTMILTIFLNGIVLVTFHVDKRRRMSTKCINIFITNLAVCQLLIGLIVMPFVQVSILYDGWKSNSILCQFNGFSTSICFYTSVLMLCVISLDRYVAIVMATRYQKLLTRKKGIIIVILIWSFSSLLSLPPLIGWSAYQYNPGTYHCSPLWLNQCGYFYFTFTVSVIIPTSFTIFSYSVIFWKVRKHRKRISLWKHGGNSVNASHVNEGQESVTQMEMSQIATAYPDTKFTVSKTPTMGNSPISDRKTLSPASQSSKNNRRHLATPENANQNAVNFTAKQNAVTDSANPNTVNTKVTPNTIITTSTVFTATPNTTNASEKPNVIKTTTTPNTIKSSVSTENLILKENGLSNENYRLGSLDDEKNKGSDSTDEMKSKKLIFQNHQVFYQPDSSTSLNKLQEVRNIIVKEFENSDTREKYYASSAKEALQVNDASLGKKERNITSNELAKRKNTASKERKTSRNRSNQDFQHVRLTEEAENELLNVSDQGKETSENNETSTSSRDSTTTAATGNATTLSPVDNTETAEEIKVTTDKIDEDKIRVVISRLNSRNGKTKKKSHSKRGSKKTRTSHTLREFKVAKTGAILLMFFMMCFGPYTIVHLCHLPYTVPLWAQHIAMWCVFFNSILSPLIYGFMQKETRKRVRDILCKCLK